MPVLSRTIKTSISTAVIRKSEERAMKIVSDRTQNLRDLLEQKVKQFVINKIRLSHVYRGIVGDFAFDKSGRDLQSEFGLDGVSAKTAGARILEVLYDLVKVKIISSERKLSTGLEIQVIGLDPANYYGPLTDQSPMRYTSSGKRSKLSSEINWMALILNARNAVIDNYIGNISNTLETKSGKSLGWGIKYVDSSEFSRSGRALMVRTSRQTAKIRFPYIVPRSVIPTRGQDFIQDIFLQKSVRKQIGDIISQIVKNPRLRTLN